MVEDGIHPRLFPPRAVLEIARTLEKAGHETWAVGGAIRDALLGELNLDWDLATAATPKQVRRLFPRTVPIGIDFGTIGVLDDAGVMHEVTTFRRDVQTDGRHAVVEFGASLDDDLARRDFTINAIAYSPSSGALHDPFGGRADLERGIVRAVGVPDERMREDRLRALRAIRFAARFGFAIDRETWDAITRSAPHLGRLSAERVKQELDKTMEQVARPSVALEMWRRAGALRTLIPQLDAVPEVTVRSLDFLHRADGRRPGLVDERRLLRLTALVLDLEPRAVAKLLRDLRFSNRDTAWASETVERWRELRGRLEAIASGDLVPGDGELRRLVARMGRLRVRSIFRLLAARCAASDGGTRSRWGPIHSTYRRALLIAFRRAEPLETGDLAIDGDDLRSAGIPPGPRLGRILRDLLEAVLDDPSRNRREWLLARAAELSRDETEG